MRSYKTDYDQNIIHQTLNILNFSEVRDDSYDIYFTNQYKVDKIFSDQNKANSVKGKYLNHFRNSRYLTNIALMTKQLQNLRQQKDFAHLNFKFLPLSFFLPTDIIKMGVEVDKGSSFIVYPIVLSAGDKTILIKNKAEFILFREKYKDSQFIAQKFNMSFFVINELRVEILAYALVTSFNPLCIYLYRGKLAQFYDKQYIDLQSSTIQQKQIQLQKMNYENIQIYIESRNNRQYIDNIDVKMVNAVILAARAAQEHIGSPRQSFELFEFTFQLTRDLDVFLISVNSDINFQTGDNVETAFKSGLFYEVVQKIVFAKSDKMVNVCDERTGKKFTEFLKMVE